MRRRACAGSAWRWSVKAYAGEGSVGRTAGLEGGGFGEAVLGDADEVGDGLGGGNGGVAFGAAGGGFVWMRVLVTLDRGSVACLPSVGYGHIPPHDFGHHKETRRSTVAAWVEGLQRLQEHVKLYVSCRAAWRRCVGRVVSMYVVVIYTLTRKCPEHFQPWRRQMLTSSPSSMSRMAMTCILGGTPAPASVSGNTTTAFGSQEWLNRATGGETTSPIGVREAVDRVMVLVEN